MTKRSATLFLLISLTTLSVFGQNKLSVSATITPLYTNTNYTRHYLFPDSDGQVVEPVLLAGNKGSLGYLAGITAYYNYASQWSIATGLWFRYQAIRTERLALAGEGTSSVRYRSIRLPILFNYRSSEHKLSPFYSFGPLIDIPLSARIVASRAGESTQHLRLDSESGPVFNFLLGAGGIYQVNSQIALTSQPTVTYRLGRLGGARTNFRTFELGLQMQAIYTF